MLTRAPRKVNTALHQRNLDELALELYEEGIHSTDFGPENTLIKRLKAAQKNPDLKTPVIEKVFGLPKNKVKDLLENYYYVLREGQRVSDEDWYQWIILAGRGWGKGRTISETLVRWANLKTYSKMCILNDTVEDVIINNFKGDSGVLEHSKSYNPSKYVTEFKRLLFQNGASIDSLSTTNIDKFRGRQYQVVVLDELIKYRDPEAAYRAALILARLKGKTKARVLITTTPQNIPIIKNLIEKAEKEPLKYWMVRGSTYDNKDNLDADYLSSLKADLTKEEIQQELYGELVDGSGEIFPASLIDRAYQQDYDINIKYDKVIVAVDPSMTTTKNSDETGIVVVGQKGKNYYVLDDISGFLAPENWSRAAYDAYLKFAAQVIVVEKNAFRDSTSLIFESIAPNLPLVLPNTTTSKLERSGVLRTILHHNRIRFAPHLQELRKQIYKFSASGGRSKKNAIDDRLDALLLALEHLVPLESNDKVIEFGELENRTKSSFLNNRKAPKRNKQMSLPGAMPLTSRFPQHRPFSHVMRF